MMSKKNRTRQQMEEEMRQLRKVFMTVRLMKADEVQGGKKGSAPCYAQWRRSRPCENCVARQALEKNTRKTVSGCSTVLPTSGKSATATR